jgi:DNA (cytosine-5)-methyltransferase 1
MAERGKNRRLESRIIPEPRSCLVRGEGGVSLRYLSVCSGIEAASVWADLGWQCAGVAEIEPFPCQVLAQRLGAGRPRYMPDPAADGLTAKDAKARASAIKAMDGRHMRWGNELVNFGDFTQIREDDVGPVDLLVGGTPCQSFSVAGKRLGLDDPRGNLTLEFLALAKRVRARWLVWENVPGVLSHDEGRTFGTFLGLLGECGFERWAYRVLDAQYVRVGKFPWAVPQRRRRVFAIGYSGAAGIHPRAVLFDRDSLRGDPAPRRETGQGIAPTLSARTKGGGGLGTDFDCDGGLIAAPVASTLNAAFGSKQGLEDQHVNSGCPLFVAHALRGEDFDASEDGTGRGTPIVPVAFAAQGGGVQTTLGYDPDALTCMTLGANQTPAIAFSAKDHGADANEDCSPTLRAGGHPGSHANAGVMPAVAFSITPSNSNKDYNARETAKAQALAGNGSRPSARGGDVIASRWGVRRLTPVECERLQGFDDNWTRIEWRGKPAEQCPDGPRYKACGNSMARNVMAFIGERIAAVEEIAANRTSEAA